MLLIDEIDRADEEFEAFLLEVLSDFQITIPEIGTITAQRRPAVILTSNRTRELHDALKRRCLYHWIGHPSLEREIEIVQAARARACRSGSRREAARVRRAGCARSTSRSRPASPRRSTGRRRSTRSAGRSSTPTVVEQTLGSVLKYHEDLETVRDETLARARRQARAGAR